MLDRLTPEPSIPPVVRPPNGALGSEEAFGSGLGTGLGQGQPASFASTLKVQRSASLSRPVSSPALIIACRCPFLLRLMSQQGALASLRGRHKPPHDGMRRMGRYNLLGVLAAGRRQDRRLSAH
jgi:hypothetical protein